MAETIKVTLSQPVKIGDVETCEVEMRAPNIGDEEDALQQAIRLKRGDNPLTLEMCILARVTRLNYDKLRALGNADYNLLRAAVNGLSGIEASEIPLAAGIRGQR